MMKVTLLLLACLGLASAQSVISLQNSASCQTASGCTLSSLLDASTIINLVSSVLGVGYQLQLNNLAAGSNLIIDSSNGLSSLNLDIFATGSATVTIVSGFVVNTNAFAVQQGSNVFVNGNVVITNAVSGATNTTIAAGATLYVGAQGSVNAGASSVQADGSAVVAGSITAATYTQNNANLVLNGTTNAAGAAVAYVQATNININTGATVSGNGNLGGQTAASTGATVYTSGTVSVGNSPGVVTINGDWRPSGTSTYNFEAASATSYDQLIITGKAYINGFCKCTLLNGYGPNDNQGFASITANGGTTGTFTSTVGTASNTLTKWSSPVTARQVIITYNSAVSVAISGLVLVACVLASLL